MDKVFFKVYETSEVQVSSSSSLEEAKQDEIAEGGDVAIVAHVGYKVDHAYRQPALEIILGSHYLEYPNYTSTLEQIVTAVWQAGVTYGRDNGHRLKTSEV